MTKLQIPEPVLPTFELLTRLPMEDAEKIGSLVKQFQAGGSFENFQKIFSESEFSKEAPELAEAIFSFGGLFVSQREKDSGALAEALSKAFAKKKKEEINEKSVENLQKNLTIILENSENLKKTFKAFYLLKENMHLYQMGSVITDTRLLFNDELDDLPSCGVILHQLKIDYMEDDEQKSFFVTLDKEDITKLSEVLKRALKKEEVIKKKQTNIEFITLQ